MTTTQTPERIKLQSAGTSLYMLVESAELVPVGKYPEYSFVGQIDNGRVVDLRVPKASADRQLGRLNLVLADCPGKRLMFSRDENESDPAKPFWGITLIEGAKDRQGGTGGAPNGAVAGGTTPAGGRAIAAPTFGTPATAQPAPAAKEKELHGYILYRAITEKVLADLVGLYVDAGVPIDSQTVAAISATIFIQAERR